MDIKPYVGITGFKRGEEIIGLAEVFKDDFAFSDCPYSAMFGFVVSDKRLADPYGSGAQSPPANSLPELCCIVPRWALPMMHFYTKNPENLAEQVKKLFSIGRMYDHAICRAVQLNVHSWPQISQVQSILDALPELNIVLQISKGAMDGLNNEEISMRAAGYKDMASWALIDPSGGLGIEFDVPKTIALMNLIRREMPNTIMGVAGGFHDGNVEARVREIKKGYGRKFCIDAQGKLMDLDKNLDCWKAEKYIEKASVVMLD